MAVVNRAAELGERRIAHAHVHAERQLAARKLVPDGQKTWVGKQPLAGGAEDHRRSGAKLLHFFYGRKSLLRIAQRQQAGPFESRRRRRALLADVTVVGAVERCFESRIVGHMRVQGAGKQHLRVETHAVHVLQASLWIVQRHARHRAMLALAVGAEFDQDIARGVGLLRPRTKRVGLEGAFDQPAGVEVAQTAVVVNRHRPGPAGSIGFR